jgi:hypothetical protein
MRPDARNQGSFNGNIYSITANQAASAALFRVGYPTWRMRTQKWVWCRPATAAFLSACAKKVPAKRCFCPRNCPLGTPLVRMLTIALFEAGQLEVDSMGKKTRREQTQTLRNEVFFMRGT